MSGLAALATSVYVATVLGLFGVSALYHRHTWQDQRVRVWMKRLDHSMIFLFIAGTYTPFSLLAMDQPTGYIVLGVVWGGALCGVALKLLWPHAPRWLGVPIYIALGWVAVFVLPQLLHHAGVAALVLLLVGGLLYTIGAIFYATRWPNPWPKTSATTSSSTATVGRRVPLHRDLVRPVLVGSTIGWIWANRYR